MHDDNLTEDTYEAPKSVWMRGLFMIIFAVFFNVAQTLLGVMALVQFFWLLFTKEKNQAIADFGESLGVWLARVTEFQTGKTDQKPFPWAPWGA